MESFMYFQEQVKASKLWVLHHEIFNCICIQVASFPNFFNCPMYGAYKRCGVITHLLVNIFISSFFLSLFNIIIPLPANNRGTLISTFYNIFVIFQIIRRTPLFPCKTVVFVLQNFNVYKFFF